MTAIYQTKAYEDYLEEKDLLIRRLSRGSRESVLSAAIRLDLLFDSIRQEMMDDPAYGRDPASLHPDTENLSKPEKRSIQIRLDQLRRFTRKHVELLKSAAEKLEP